MAKTYRPLESSAPEAEAPSAATASPSLFEWMGNAFAAEQIAAPEAAPSASGGWGFGSLAAGAMDLGAGLLEDAGNLGHGLLVDAMEYAEESGLADAVVDGVGDALDGAEDALGFVGELGSGILDAGGDVLDWVVDTGTPLLEEAGELVTPLIEEGGRALDWLVDGGTELLGPLIEGGGELVDLVVEQGADLVAPLVDAGEEAVSWALDEGAELLGPALDLGGEVFDWVLDRGSELSDGIGDLLGRGGELIEDIAEVFGADTENAGSLADVMSDEQMAFLHELYGDSLDLSQVRYTRDGLTPMIAGAPNTLGNTINLVSTWGPEIFDENGQITPEGMELVIHELTHTWQYQNGGWDYMPEAAWANAYHQVVDGDRNEAYRYDTSMDWEQMNPEQQGHAVEKAGYLMWRQSQGEELSADELREVEEHRKYIDAVRAGRGA